MLSVLPVNGRNMPGPADANQAGQYLAVTPWIHSLYSAEDEWRGTLKKEVMRTFTDRINKQHRGSDENNIIESNGE